MQPFRKYYSFPMTFLRNTAILGDFFSAMRIPQKANHETKGHPSLFHSKPCLTHFFPYNLEATEQASQPKTVKYPSLSTNRRCQRKESPSLLSFVGRSESSSWLSDTNGPLHFHPRFRLPVRVPTGGRRTEIDGNEHGLKGGDV